MSDAPRKGWTAAIYVSAIPESARGRARPVLAFTTEAARDAYLEDHAEVARLREALGRAERERDELRKTAARLRDPSGYARYTQGHEAACSRVLYPNSALGCNCALLTKGENDDGE